MEEILASIRRIIADDDHEPVRRPVARRDDALPDVRRAEAPRAEAARAEPPRPAASRSEVGRHPADDARMERMSADRPRPEADRVFAPRVEPTRSSLGGADGARHEALRPLNARTAESPRPEPTRAEPPRAVASRVEPVRVEAPRAEASRPEPQRVAMPHALGPRLDSSPSGVAMADASRAALRAEPVRADLTRPEMVRPEPTRMDASRSDDGPLEHPTSRPLRFDPVQPDAVRQEANAPVTDAQRPRDERRPFSDDAEAFAGLYDSDGSVALARHMPIRDTATMPPAREAQQSAPRPGADSRSARPEPRRKDLLSPAVDAAVMAAFESLGDVSMGQASLPQQGRTVEDLIKEILRPMLKTWLDDHLPDIVERLVRAEIERVARNGR